MEIATDFLQSGPSEQPLPTVIEFESPPPSPREEPRPRAKSTDVLVDFASEAPSLLENADRLPKPKLTTMVSCISVKDKVNEFALARSMKKRRHFLGILMIVLVLCVVGAICVLLVAVFREFKLYFGLLGAMCVSAALLAYTAIPSDDMQIDEFLLKRRWSIAASIFLGFGSALLSLVAFPSAHALLMVPCIGLVLRVRKPTVWLCTFFILSTSCWLPHFIYLAIYQDARSFVFYTSSHLSIVYVTVGSLWVLMPLGCWFVVRRDVGILQFYNTLSAVWTTYGVGLTIIGAVSVGQGDSENQHWLAVGLVCVVPSIVLVILGRGRIFSFLAEWFERKHAPEDGAFMAELLESNAMVEGNTWWVHHGGRDPDFPDFDPRQNWTQGVIVEVRDEYFIVDTSQIMSTARTGASTRSSRSSRGMLQRSDSKVLGFSFSMSISRRSSNNSRKSKSAMDLKRSTSNISEVVMIKRNDGNLPAKDLLEMGKANLRCIEWQDITLKLLTRTVQAPTAEVVEGSEGENHEQELHALSRPVRRNEIIDFFISHSWYDDPEMKYEQLSELAEQFKAAHQRYPTFWFDKVCIDQTKISDGLKVLPVNVMACSKMLVLCGQTYLTRLWCAWELCTLFSFMEEQVAVRRLRVVPLDHGAEYDISVEIKTFDVTNAHCYDPNEEAKLQEIIDAVGKERFNHRIRSLAYCLVNRSRSGSTQSVTLGRQIASNVGRHVRTLSTIGSKEFLHVADTTKQGALHVADTTKQGARRVRSFSSSSSMQLVDLIGKATHSGILGGSSSGHNMEDHEMAAGALSTIESASAYEDTLQPPPRAHP